MPKINFYFFTIILVKIVSAFDPNITPDQDDRVQVADHVENPTDNGQTIENRLQKRQSRTIYFICGIFPNIVYQQTPCERCRNGGKALYMQCTNAVQCASYSRGPVECIDGQCCTGNDLDINYPDDPYNPNRDPYSNDKYTTESYSGNCPRGETSNIRCSGLGQCPPDRICLSGLCCRRSEEDYREACGGQMAISTCIGGICLNRLVCAASNFCCQCQVGRSGGRCNQGACAPGYRCQNNEWCCSSCPDGQMPFGICRATDSFNYNINNGGQGNCPVGHACLAGDICCRI